MMLDGGERYAYSGETDGGVSGDGGCVVHLRYPGGGKSGACAGDRGRAAAPFRRGAA